MLLFLLLSCRFEPHESGKESTPIVDSDTDTDTDSDTDTDTDSDRAPLALVSDGSRERFVWLRLDTREILYELDLPTEYPDFCRVDGHDTICDPYQSEPMVNPTTGEDQMLYTFHRMHLDNPVSIGSRISKIERRTVTADSATIEWSLDSLDFSLFAGNASACEQTAPCTSPTDDYEKWRKCNLVMVHDVEILDEDESNIRLLVTDTANDRVLFVALDKSSTCGVVEDIIGEATYEGWDYLDTNDADRVMLSDGEAYLVNQKATFTDSEHYSGGTGKGKATLWRKQDDAWTLLWEHPPRSATYPSFLNAPHDSSIITWTDGRQYLVYAHSNGNGAEFESDGWGPDDYAGSVGLGLVEGSTLTYLGDGILPEPSLFGFTRSVQMLDDGSLVVTNSGCKGDNSGCPRTPGIHHIEWDLSAVTAPGTDGRFTADHAMQQMLSVTEAQDAWASPVDCGFGAPYVTHVQWSDEVGPGLQARMLSPVSVCE